MSLLSFVRKKTGSTKKPNATKAKKTSSTKSIATKSKQTSVAAYSKLDLQPLISEKGVLLQENNFTVFRVPVTATKHMIKTAVREKYKVKPLAVKTMSMPAKIRRRGTTIGRTIFWKKAYVQVDDVQKISTSP